MSKPPDFDYASAFSRNLGWVTPQEQQRLSTARVAIAGMGGVGGAHTLTLARLGIGNFHIADFDRFEVHNFNRQAGASMSTLAQPKVDVMRRLALDINPQASVTAFGAGVTRDNLDAFLDGVDVYVDGQSYPVKLSSTTSPINDPMASAVVSWLPALPLRPSRRNRPRRCAMRCWPTPS